MVRRDARIWIGPDAAVIGATDGALDLLGLSLAELQALPPGGLSLEADVQAAEGFEAEWRKAGERPIFGSGTVRLLDGRLVRVRYVINPLPDAGFEVILERSRENVSAAPRMFTAGSVLSAWRAAERRLAEIDPDSPEWPTAKRESDHFRDEFRRVTQSGTNAPGPGKP